VIEQPKIVEDIIFPSTRYQGSKRKILGWIAENISDLDFDTVLDAFGGTASVSYLLKQMGKTVTYNDFLKFNHFTGLALIENDRETFGTQEINSLIERVQKNNSNSKFIQNTFKGFYYKDEENKWLDEIIYLIKEEVSKKSKYKEAIAYHALFQSCLIKRPFNLFHRKNLYIRTARVERQFGNKRTWEKKFSDAFIHFVNETNNAVFSGENKCIAINKKIEDISEGNYDLIYLDPPYLSKDKFIETSNYKKSYHFLEGIANYDQWENMVDYDSTIRKIKETETNPWINPKTNTAALDSLLSAFPKSIFVFSYKKFGSPSVETLVRLFKRHDKKVRTHSRHYKYALNSQNGSAKLNREVLIIAS
jgi:adenine-specific DNA-methyltransferase